MCEKRINFVVRQMETSDYESVRQIIKSLTFLTSKYDNETMANIDAHGLFVAQDLNTGEILGMCSAVNISPELSFVGQYGVRQEYQNLGIGSELWRKAMAHTGHRNVGLYARGKMFDKYKDECNFRVIPPHIGLVFSGKIDSKLLIKSIEGISVVPISEDNIEKVIQYDKEVCNGLDRSVVIRHIIKINEYVSAVAINQNNEVLGYTIIKTTNYNTGIVEPLYANNEKIAELLFANCCMSLPITQTNGVLFNCWNSNTKSIDLAKRLGLQIERELPILFTKQIVLGNMDRIYCVSSRCFYPF